MKNTKVFILSLIALLFLVGGLLIHWSLIIVSVILMLINQKELLKKK